MNIEKYIDCVKTNDCDCCSNIYYECQCENNKNKCECLITIKNHTSMNNKIIDYMVGDNNFDCDCDSDCGCECLDDFSDNNCLCNYEECNCAEEFLKCQCNCIICKDCREYMQNN